MKRACVVLFGIGILLILWGAGDLVCWGTTGKELLERYRQLGREGMWRNLRYFL